MLGVMRMLNAIAMSSIPHGCTNNMALFKLPRKSIIVLNLAIISSKKDIDAMKDGDIGIAEAENKSMMRS